MLVRYPLRAAVIPLVLIAIQACSSSKNAAEAATGGVTGSSGSSGGALLGGASSESAGGSNPGQGGTTAAGTTTSQTGGAAGLGGASNMGAASNTGGATNTNGASSVGGVTNTGGALAAGGTKSTGGAPTMGGAKSTAGAPATGGTKSTGGTNATGGTKSLGSIGATGGTADTGGATVCKTAAEESSVTLTCPQGQIVDSVVFASYGTPTGTCGSYAAGSCNAASSKTMVESLCLGRSACTVPATNGAFGDPCRSTTKSLAVEVACVVGTPIVVPDIPYKGVANSPADEIEALGATWCYNWGTTPQSTDCDDPYFVPMIWGPGDVAGAIKSIGNAGYTTVLGFNEPNKSDQSNMLVADAISLWPTLTSNSNIRVGSPAVSDNGRTWLEDFMSQVQAKGLRVDFIAMHWYGWNAGSCVVGQLEGAINWASQWGLPVWITEFGCMGSSNTDEQTVMKFYNDAVVMLNNHPLVERYAWYPWNTYNHLYENSVMTALGRAFAAAPQYRQ